MGINTLLHQPPLSWKGFPRDCGYLVAGIYYHSTTRALVRLGSDGGCKAGFTVSVPVYPKGVGCWLRSGPLTKAITLCIQDFVHRGSNLLKQERAFP